LAPDLELVSRRQALLEVSKSRLSRPEDLRCQHAGGGKAQDGDGAKVLPTPNPSSLEDAPYRGHRKQRDSRAQLRRVDIEVLELSELCPFVSTQPSHD